MSAFDVVFETGVVQPYAEYEHAVNAANGSSTAAVVRSGATTYHLNSRARARPKALASALASYEQQNKVVKASLPTRSKTPSIGYRWQLVTPEQATQWLDRKATNRSVAQTRVNLYAAEMCAGRWLENHQPIAFSADGTLLDGEHRLWAVIEANVTVGMWVAEGLTETARLTVDQGRSRSVADALRVQHGLKDATRIASWCRIIDATLAGRTLVLSPATVLDRMATYGTSLTWLLNNAPRQRPYNRSAVAAALLLAHSTHAEATMRFTQDYVSGLNLTAGNPAHLLRNHLAASVREHERSLCGRALRCLQAAILREDLLKFVPTSSEEGIAFFR